MTDGILLTCNVGDFSIFRSVSRHTSSLPFCDIEIERQGNLGVDFNRNEWAYIQTPYGIPYRARLRIKDPEQILQPYDNIKFFLKFVSYHNQVRTVLNTYRLASSNNDALMLLKLTYGNVNE